MLSDREKEGCRTILNKLSQQDLVTLTDTVTNRIVSPESTKGTTYYTTCKVMVNKFKLSIVADKLTFSVRYVHKPA